MIRESMLNTIEALIAELSNPYVRHRAGRDEEILAALRFARQHVRPRFERTMEDAIEEVLRDTGRPMRAREIFEAMSDPPTRAALPLEIVNKWLSTSKRFKRVSPGLYVLNQKEIRP